MKTRIPALALAALFAAAPGFGHDDELRGEMAPRLGLISDEVAVQRLTLAGVRAPEVLSRGPEGVALRGEVVLTLDPATGVVVDALAPGLVVVPLGNRAAPPPEPVDRGRIADPALMRGAVEILER